MAGDFAWLRTHRPRRHGIALLAVFAGLSWFAGPSSAQTAAGDWVQNTHSELRLIASEATVAEGETAARDIRLGLEFRIKDGWKIYWRSPGDAGYPPRIDWSGSENLAEARILWPAPERFSVLGFETVGYKKHVILPLDVRLEQAGAELKLAAAVDYLICDDICVPYSVDLRLDLPAGPAQISRFANAIDQFAARIPANSKISGIDIERAEVLTDGEEPLLVIAARARAGFTAPDLFIETEAPFAFGKPEVRLSADSASARLEMPVYALGADTAALVGTPITLTLVDGSRALEASVTVLAGVAPSLALDTTLLTILGLALLGGLILNLMPCVLPVLSLKLMHGVSYGGAERAAVRRGFLATAAGILTSFVVLAGGLIGLKLAGVGVGWGIQFQQPIFLGVMVLILLGFAANLWGLFEVRLPSWLNTMAARPALAAGPAGSLGAATGPGPGGGAGPGLGAMSGATGGMGRDFMTGAFVTLLATPCSAPFLGTAVGFALARGPGEILAVFVMLGLGLSLPYLAVAAAPGLATRLPRPGPWMVHLRRFLGFTLLATAIWLVSVIVAQLGPSNAPAADTLTQWRAFERAAIAREVSAGNTVIVDVTADWCITCQVNKALVLDTEAIDAALSADGVVAMRADWTRPDTAIADYLAAHERYGIPFDAVYGPGAPSGIVLPELLTKSAVLDALEKAAGGD